MDDLIVGSQGIAISPIYFISVATAFCLVFIFPLTKDFGSQHEKNQYFYLQGITLLGAIFGAKLAVLMGDAIWPLRPFNEWGALIFSGRSIVGALLFGFIFVEIAKPLMNYQRLPNDRFAIVLPFSIAIGRIGCWFTGCCLGVETDSSLGIKHLDDINRYPIAMIELFFHLSVGLILIHFFRRQQFQGQIFALFMIFYGSFRFLTEFIRDTEKAFYGLSAYQYFAMMLVIAGMISFLLRNKQSIQGLHYGNR